MIVEIVGWGILSGVVIFQQVLIGQLTNKLMSRNYGDYVIAEKSLANKPVERRAEVEEFDDYAASQAQKANRLFRA